MAEPLTKVKYELQGNVAVIKLNDPATMNAAGIDMIDELFRAVKQASKEARGIVLTGEGRGFCSGANLGGGGGGGGDRPLGDRDAGDALESHYNPFMTFVRELPIPIVTAINGAAAGVGCSIALMGDIIIAGESSYFLQAFRRIGLVPDGGSSYLLPRSIGRARAMEMMLLGEKLPAPKALEWGLINRCVPDHELMPTALAMATELANGPKAIAMIRKLGWDSLDTHWRDQLANERNTQRDAGRTKDFAEGVAAFLQKRPAKFTGA